MCVCGGGSDPQPHKHRGAAGACLMGITPAAVRRPRTFNNFKSPENPENKGRVDQSELPSLAAFLLGNNSRRRKTKSGSRPLPEERWSPPKGTAGGGLLSSHWLRRKRFICDAATQTAGRYKPRVRGIDANQEGDFQEARRRLEGQKPGQHDNTIKETENTFQKCNQTTRSHNNRGKARQQHRKARV